WRLIVGAARLLAVLVALRRLCLQPEQLRQLEIVARAGLRLGVDRRLRQALIVGANGFGQERLVLNLAALQDGVSPRAERACAAVAGAIVEAAAEVILGLAQAGDPARLLPREGPAVVEQPLVVGHEARIVAALLGLFVLRQRRREIAPRQRRLRLPQQRL